MDTSAHLQAQAQWHSVNAPSPPQVSLHSIVTEAALAAKADALEAVVAQGDREGLKAYCQAQATAAT